MSSDSKKVINSIFEKHGSDAVYITNTGFNSRLVHDMFPENKNIFYMQGSMGLSPAIALGIAEFCENDVVALVGDGSFLMHMGITHTIRDRNLPNLFVYVLDNGCHESVGGYPCSKLDDEYPGVEEVIRVNESGKYDRVKIGFEDCSKNIKEFLSGRDSIKPRTD